MLLRTSTADVRRPAGGAVVGRCGGWAGTPRRYPLPAVKSATLAPAHPLSTAAHHSYDRSAVLWTTLGAALGSSAMLLGSARTVGDEAGVA
ncbi:hypothetical protein BJP39_21035 [Streptomyces sp. CC77]|nr:hypothetical protein BJP39_21035 [Streptomyces sp. CC77]